MTIPSQPLEGVNAPLGYPDLNQVRATVLSDIHLLAPEYIADTPYFHRVKNKDRKKFEGAHELLDLALQKAEENNSRLLLIPGDLTKDGEYASHQYIVNQLEAYKDRHPESMIIVTPGNHDVNNHTAITFRVSDPSLDSEPVRMTRPKDFLDLYKPFIEDGQVSFYKDTPRFQAYLDQVNESFDRDEENRYYAQGYTSYSKRMDMDVPGERGLTVISLDTCIYSLEYSVAHRDGVHNTSGVLTEAQMSWFLDEVEAAKARSDMILAVAHHAFIPHFYKQEELLKPYVIKNWDQPFVSEDPRVSGKWPAEILADNDVAFLFTGHMHAQDIARYTSAEGKELYDIETGSLITYPYPIRHMTLTNASDWGAGAHFRLDIESHCFKTLSYENAGGEWIENESLLDDGEAYISADLMGGIVHAYLTVPGQSNVMEQIIEDNFHDLDPEEDLYLQLARQIMKGVGSPEEPLRVPGLSFENKIYYGPVEDLEGLRKKGDPSHYKLAFDFDLMGKQKYMITEYQGAALLKMIFDSINTHIFSHVDFVEGLAIDLAGQALAFSPIEDPETGEAKSLKDLMNTLYEGYLAGDERQVNWVKIYQELYERYNVYGALFTSLSDAIADAIFQVADRLVYNEKISSYVQTDGKGNPLVKAFFSRLINQKFGRSLADTLSLVFMRPGQGSKSKKKVDLGEFIRMLAPLTSQEEGQEPENKLQAFVSAQNHKFSEYINGLSHEGQPEYPYTYLQDNDTILFKQLDEETLLGQIEIGEEGQMSVVHNLDLASIQHLSLIYNNTVEIPLEIGDLESLPVEPDEGDWISVRFHIHRDGEEKVVQTRPIAYFQPAKPASPRLRQLLDTHPLSHDDLSDINPITQSIFALFGQQILDQDG